ncbi:hypothetical protein FOE78_03675 [Microlunatus elymi]|uniref:Transposase zinc-ribbon domain-containing protein n=1 Tax=Microlunatus elymi TaxID=2596828 RepID=A0A516PVE2_9ACTN|nr:hypothetical protein [Microlunatus elymi]QDP95133.1 hypothetical protein FOE78_03675 [Microlunatus elymi]
MADGAWATDDVWPDDEPRPVGCPEHGRGYLRPARGTWECGEDAILISGHATYRCAACGRVFDHDISGPDVQWIIQHGA